MFENPLGETNPIEKNSYLTVELNLQRSPHTLHEKSFRTALKLPKENYSLFFLRLLMFFSREVSYLVKREFKS